ncbi:hypothetical protein KEM52_000900, partial [Ascosphaera acerosa]
MTTARANDVLTMVAANAVGRHGDRVAVQSEMALSEEDIKDFPMDTPVRSHDDEDPSSILASVNAILALPPNEIRKTYDKMAMILNERDIQQQESYLHFTYLTKVIENREIFAEEEANQQLNLVEGHRFAYMLADARTVKARETIVKKYRSKRIIALVSTKVHGGASNDFWQQ